MKWFQRRCQSCFEVVAAVALLQNFSYDFLLAYECRPLLWGGEVEAGCSWMLCNVPLCLLKNVSVLPLFMSAKYLIHCYTLGLQSLFFFFLTCK